MTRVKKKKAEPPNTNSLYHMQKGEGEGEGGEEVIFWAK